MTATDHLADFSTTDDALVLASVSSKAESDLLDDWLRAQRKAHPDTKVEVLRLPHEDAPPQLIEHLASELEAGEDRTVVPVRVFWVPGGLPTRVKLVGLISGRDTYRPPDRLQRAILRKDPSRARIVAGEPAKVSELRQQWRENTVGETREDFAKFVLRRASLAIERIELRLLGPEYKSPRLITDELMSSSRFIDGMKDIPGATPEKAEAMSAMDTNEVVHWLSVAKPKPWCRVTTPHDGARPAQGPAQTHSRPLRVTMRLSGGSVPNSTPAANAWPDRLRTKTAAACMKRRVKDGTEGSC